MKTEVKITGSFVYKMKFEGKIIFVACSIYFSIIECQVVTKNQDLCKGGKKERSYITMLNLAIICY